MKSDSPLKVAVLLALLGVLAWHLGQPWWARAHVAWRGLFVSPPSPSVIFIVLDNVRADRLSLCGNPRPTSPTLDGLAAAGATYSCEASSPGAWTLPSHASYFTGLDPVAHGAHYVTGPAAPAQPLRPEAHTLAERFAERGRQTLCVSGNPVIGPETNATQGCQRQVTSPRFPDLLDDALIAALQQELVALDPDTPLFLFLNIADAHRPWRAVPEGLGWIPPRPPFNIDAWEEEVQAYLQGTMDPEAAEAYLAHLDDAYTYGIHRADRTLGRALETLASSGWLTEDTRLVITSDHGEFLGEHRMLGHGRHIWEPDVNVPLLIRGPEAPASLPAPMSAIDVFQYLDTGAITTPTPIKLTAWPNRIGEASDLPNGPGSQTSAGLRTGATKWIWTDGEARRYDLDADPEELHGELLEPPPALLSWAEAVMASSGSEEIMDPEMLEALRAAGYID
ncbi:MAG: sulfatase-like hydrolase/transferase [Alphaproteobacteria bacterium]|nr:sulfatase-like hydrolase/transferase [Alphaproteobacteria bacterium]